jgi:hypothetical protein
VPRFEILNIPCQNLFARVTWRNMKCRLQQHAQVQPQRPINYTACQYLPQGTDHAATWVSGTGWQVPEQHCIRVGIAVPGLPGCMKMSRATPMVDNKLYTHHQCLPQQTPDTAMRVNGVGQQWAQMQCFAADAAALGQPQYMRRHTALHSRSGLTARRH